MDTIVYEVWGEDTFARETYLVGTYKTREAANKALQASERSVLSQCEELRDTFWIVELTPEREAEREKREEEDRRRRAFDYAHLRRLITRLNNRLLEIVEQDIRGLCSEPSVDLVEENKEAGDCYSSLSFRYIKEIGSKKSRAILIKIEFKDMGDTLSGCFTGTPVQIKKRFSLPTAEDFVSEIACKLIEDFFYKYDRNY